MSYKIALFCEAGSKRGLGHLVRSYVLFTGLKQLGHCVDFYLDSDIDVSEKYCEARYFQWKTLQIKQHYDVVFIDSYEADLKIYEMIWACSKIAVYLDDYQRLDYPPGVIINFSPTADKSLYQNQTHPHRYLLGIQYVPLREAFGKKNEKDREHLFIMLGGNDVLNLTYCISEYLVDIDVPKVVVSNSVKTVEMLKKLSNVKVLYKPSDALLIENMQKAKAAVSTASMTLYEFAALGVPTIIIAVSKDQIHGAKSLEESGLAYKYIDISDTRWLVDLHAGVCEVVQQERDTQKRLDAFGKDRIISEVLEMLK